MKTLSLTLVFLFFSNTVFGQAAKVQGQQATSGVYSPNILIPNQLATKINGTTSLLETGNPNILANPNYEHSTVNTSWTVADAAISAETSDVIDGKQALKLVYIGDPVNLTQDSIINVTGLSDGVQGIAYLRVKNGSDKTLYLCGRSAGVTASASNCATIPNTNKWIHAKLPVILGGTSNGIALTSNGEFTTGTIIVDDAFLGAQDVKQDVDQSRLVGSLRSTGAAGCDWQTSSGTGTGVLFAADTDCGTPTVSGDISTPATKIPGFTASLAPGKYQVIYKGGFGDSTADGNPAIFSLNDGTNNYNPQTQWATTAAQLGSVLVFNFEITSQESKTYNLKCATPNSGAVQTCRVFNASSLIELGIDVYYFPPSSSIYSTAADSFSTDTNALTFSASAITSSSPIGTYNTYSYASSSNTKTICATAPTTAPTKADGFLIYTRAYNAASTCGNPARVEIKIAEAGTSLPTLSRELYKGAGKNVAGLLENDNYSSETVHRGVRINTYNATSGTLTVDAGLTYDPVTSHAFLFEDLSSQSSGYLVINAQKMKDSVVGSFKDFDYVYVKTATTVTRSMPNATFTTVIYDDEEIDTHNAYDAATGSFTTPVGGVYCFNAVVAPVFEGSHTVDAFAEIYKPGTGETFRGSRARLSATATTSGAMNFPVDKCIPLETSEVAQIRLYQSTGATRFLEGSVPGNNLTITRIPGQFQ